MKHNLNISILRKPQSASIVRYRTVTLRERFLERMLGTKQHVTILVPGDSVHRVSITEQGEDGDDADSA